MVNAHTYAWIILHRSSCCLNDPTTWAAKRSTLRATPTSSTSVASLWKGLMDCARHVTGCRFTQETTVQHAFDDVASTIHQSLACGIRLHAGSDGKTLLRHLTHIKRVPSCIKNGLGMFVENSTVLIQTQRTRPSVTSRGALSTIGFDPLRLRLLLFNDATLQTGGHEKGPPRAPPGGAP